MDLLVDSTGRPGPATWEVGNFAAGKADYPVGGVSWYEAAAYASFRGKSLPTVYHWVRAALPSSEHVMSLATEIVPLSNFGGDGPAPVGSYPGIGASGAADLAGNFREWCWNASGELRYSLGGSWNEPVYMFQTALRMDPFDRSPANGFRCMKGRNGETAEELKASVDLPIYDFYKMEGLSDEVFQEYMKMFSYGKTPLNPVLESADETRSDWRRESVSIDSAYGERFTIHLDLPARASPPYQAVVYFPGSQRARAKNVRGCVLGAVRLHPQKRTRPRPAHHGGHVRAFPERPVRPGDDPASDARASQQMGAGSRENARLPRESRRHRCGKCRLHGAESGPGRGPVHARVRA